MENAVGDKIYEKAFLERGTTSEAPLGALQVSGESRDPRLKGYETFLKKFQYGHALDAALKVGHHVSSLILSRMETL